MAHIEPNGTTTTSGSPSTILPQEAELPAISPLQQDQPIEDNSIVCETANSEEKECPDAATPNPTTGGDDDDVLFIFSAPRSKKQQRRRLESLHATPVINPPCEHPSYPPATSLEHTTRRGTTGMVQGLEGCHIADNDIKPTTIRGASLPIAPPITSEQTHDMHLPSIDPTTEPNFVAMQDLLPDSSLHWWNEPEANFHSTQMNPGSWMDFQEEPSSSEHTWEGVRSDGRVDSVDDQISPRTKPATNFHENVNWRDPPADSRGLEKKSPDPMIYQPPLYYSSRMPSWSRNWTAFSETGNRRFSRARIPSSTPLSVVRNAFRPSPQQGLQGQVHHRAPQYPSQSAPYPQRHVQGQPNHGFQHYHENPCFASMGTKSHFGEMATPDGRNPDALTSSSQPSSTASAQSPSAIQHPQNFQNRETARPQIRPTPPRVENPNDVLRKPSLYKIPSWPAAGPKISDAPSTLHPSAAHHQPQATMPPNPPYRQPPESNMHMSSPSPSSQCPSLNDPDPPVARRRGARKFTPNLIVDIAETCQQLFPFAMIADRHSVPLQKVFDTFSAIIQLPLLRNADDKRRHGSLGKRRMRDFREAKKKMAEEMKGVKRGSEEMGGAGGGNAEKRIRREQPLLRCAVMNNVREREGGGGL